MAISNARLVFLPEGQVRFRYKDYADGSRWKVTQLSAEEFIRRFLLHVLPKRFVRIRHYGLLAGRNVPTKLTRCRELLGASARRPEPVFPSQGDVDAAATQPAHLLCPHCRYPLRRHAFDGPATTTARWTDRVVPVPVLDSS